MDIASVIRRVQRIFGDSASVQITPNDVIDWINEGQLRITRETECLLKDQTFDMPISSAGPYALPPDFIRAKRVAFDGNKIVETLRESVEDSVPNSLVVPSGADPLYYYIEGSGLYVYPANTKTGTALLSMRYIFAPAEIAQGTTSGVLALPLIHHEALVRFCLMRANELNENETAVRRLNDDVYSQIGQGQFDQSMQSDSYPVVRDYDEWLR